MENKAPIKLIDVISTQESLLEIKSLCRFYSFKFRVDESDLLSSTLEMLSNSAIKRNTELHSSSPKTYFIGAIRFCALIDIDSKRKAIMERDYDLSHIKERPADLDNKDLIKSIDKGFDDLFRTSRDLLKLRYVYENLIKGDTSIKDVAESLSVSQLSIRVMTNRIRGKIKEKFSAARY